ncbi:tRNA (uracil(54)-C(5))-methyltransferase homolog [Dromiciops gliroides]|uniref:tRNA (uracil(54)-C(5))-methyltransferase homolog n=1 Tax=Dromiciops gliroides TaxID=33562 RepID=UPI001CC6582A|nr:tRNA (uracil(54)-C(5))-methyltransferase homolog [Dromiciops gliroides]
MRSEAGKTTFPPPERGTDWCGECWRGDLWEEKQPVGSQFPARRSSFPSCAGAAGSRSIVSRWPRRLPVMRRLSPYLSRAALLSRGRPPPWSSPRAWLGAACPEKAALAPTATATEEWGPELGSWPERLADLVTPLWRLAYEQQLRVKAEALRGLLERLEERLRSLGSPDAAEAGALCSRLQPFRPSPVIEGYRNKCNFAIRQSPDGRPRTVGYVLGGGQEQRLVCVPPAHLKHIPERHQRVARCYQAFLAQSPLEPYLDVAASGHWHELTVRSTRRGHTMAVISFHPQQLGPEELWVHKEQVRDFFTRGPGAVCDLTSLYLQENASAQCGQQQPCYQLLAGEPHIFEDLAGLRIRISPGAFFQINGAAVEVLYQVVGELSGVDANTLLLDLSQGTGATSLSLARRTAQVLSTGLVGQAVGDARWTAAFNGITNWEFHDDHVENVVAQLVKSQEAGQSLVALVDPSRTGLNSQVVRALRNCRAIRTLLFVSCYPSGKAKRNFLELCCPPDPDKDLLGDPFVLRQAVPVDMFPHTLHYELVLLFTR